MLTSDFIRSGSLPAAAAPGQSIYFDDRGPIDVPAVLLAHGMTGYTFDLRTFKPWPENSRRLIAPHMRGVGGSLPTGATDQNLIPAMAEDMEALRRECGVGRVTVFGWSGGAALALAYAETYPQYVDGVVLYGTWLGTEAELTDYYDHAAKGNPEAWRVLQAFTGKAETMNVLRGLNDVVRSGDPDRATEAVICHEMIYETPLLDYDRFRASRSPLDWQAKVRQRAVSFNMYANVYGLTHNQLEDNIGRLDTIPILLIHAADDTEVTIDAARRIAAVAPNARLEILPDAGHDLREEAVQQKLRPLLANFPPPLASPTSKLTPV